MIDSQQPTCRTRQLRSENTGQCTVGKKGEYKDKFSKWPLNIKCMCSRYTDAQCALYPHRSLSALVRPGSEWCLVPMLGSGGVAARPPHTCSLCDTYTSASGSKLSAGVWNYHTSKTDKISASPVSFDKSRLCPYTSPKCSVDTVASVTTDAGAATCQCATDCHSS